MAPKKKETATTLPRNSTLPPSLLEKYKGFKGITAIERRILTGELPGTVDLRLKEDPSFQADPVGRKRYWYLRWINTKIPGRFSTVTSGMGYEPVRLNELQDGQAESISNLYRDGKDGENAVVKRGDKGEEILVKIPLELYTAIKHSQKDARDRRNRSAKQVKHDMASRAAASIEAGGLGSDEAADFIYDDSKLTLRRTRTSLGEELSEQTDVMDEA